MNEQIFKDKGTELTLRDGKKYFVVPLTLNELIDIWPLIAKVDGLKDSKQGVKVEHLKLMRELIYKILKTTNKDLTEEKAGELIDLKDLAKIMAIVVGQNQETLKQLAD